MHKTRQILRRPKVEEITGLSRSSIYAKMAAGDFPQAVRLGPRCVGWFADEVNGWLEARAEERGAA